LTVSSGAVPILATTTEVVPSEERCAEVISTARFGEGKGVPAPWE